MAAIDAVANDIFNERATSDQERTGPTPEHGRQSVLRADACVRIFEQRVASDSPEPVVAPTRQMVVHVDASALIKRDESGRCHIEDGSWLSPVAAQWLACDSDVVSIVERDGKPLDVGRAKRVISPRMRLALQARDRGCRYPGCGVPAKRTDGHHIRHWLDFGLTELANLISLCRFHHRRHHECAFEIRVLDDGDFAFERSDGTSIVPVEPVPANGRFYIPDAITAQTAVARSGGERCNFEHTVYVLANTGGGRSP